MRDEVVDFVDKWTTTTELPATRLIKWLGIARGKFYDWRKRYGKANEHNGKIPRDHWITDEERQSILDFHDEYPREGYRRLTFMMLDADVVAVSPTTVYRVLSDADRLKRWNRSPSKKGQGFKQPLAPHDHWHIDIAYLNVSGTFYYLCSSALTRNARGLLTRSGPPAEGTRRESTNEKLTAARSQEGGSPGMVRG